MPFDPSLNPYVAKCSEYPGWLFEEKEANVNRGKWRTVLDREKIVVEIGPGNGIFFQQYLRANPEVGSVAIEKKFKRSIKTVEKIKRSNLKHGRVIRGRGELLRDYFDSNEIDEYIINFPTPWVKPRHKKHILFSGDFVLSMIDTLKPDGKISLKSDHYEYMTIAAEQLVRNKLLIKFGEKLFEDMDKTSYETKVTKLGHSIYTITAFHHLLS